MSKTSYDTSKLVQYNFSLPNRSALIIARIVSWFGSFAALGYLIWLVVQLVRSAGGYSKHLEAPSPLQWILALVALLAGVTFANITGEKYRKYFVVVRQGYVIDRDTTGGGGVDFASDVEWHVAIYGCTYANTTNTYWMTVSAGDWHELTKGDLVDYR